MAAPDWETEVRPVLIAIYRAFDDAGTMFPTVTSEDINQQLGREPDDSRQSVALEHLERAGYICGSRAFGGSWGAISLEEKGLVEVAGWPAQPGMDYGSMLVDEIDGRISSTTDDDERSRLQQLRTSILEIGKDVVTSVLTDLARRGI